MANKRARYAIMISVENRVEYINPAQDSINQSRHNVSTTYLGSRRDARHGEARSSMSLVNLWAAGDIYGDSEGPGRQAPSKGEENIREVIAFQGSCGTCRRHR